MIIRTDPPAPPRREMRVYLAGPMTGLPWFNHPAFDRAAAALRAMGFEVDNPAEADRADGFDPANADLPPGFLARAMARNCKAVCGADAIALLPGWERSKGVAIELALAKYLGLAVLDATTGDVLLETPP